MDLAHILNLYAHASEPVIFTRAENWTRTGTSRSFSKIESSWRFYVSDRGGSRAHTTTLA